MSPPSHSPPLLPKSIKPSGDQSLALGPGTANPARSHPSSWCRLRLLHSEGAKLLKSLESRLEGSLHQGILPGKIYSICSHSGNSREEFLLESWCGIPLESWCNPWDAVGYSGMLWNAPEWFRISQGCCGIPRNALQCLWDAEDAVGYSDAAEFSPPHSSRADSRMGAAPQPPPPSWPSPWLGRIVLEFSGKPRGARWLQHSQPHPSLIRHGFPGSAAQPRIRD